MELSVEFVRHAPACVNVLYMLYWTQFMKVLRSLFSSKIAPFISQRMFFLNTTKSASTALESTYALGAYKSTGNISKCVLKSFLYLPKDGSVAKLFRKPIVASVRQHDFSFSFKSIQLTIFPKVVI